ILIFLSLYCLTSVPVRVLGDRRPNRRRWGETQMTYHARLRHNLVPLALGVFLSAASPALHGQTLKGTILGTVTDATQAVISSAQLSVTEINTNFRRTETTNEEGFYVFANLDPGTYRVEVEHPGFRKVIRSGIDLTPNSTARIDLELTPGAVSEVIDVTA